MKTYIYNILLKKVALILLISIGLLGCEDFLEIDDPKGQIVNKEVFKDEVTATAAVTSIYAKLRDEGLLTGNPYGMNTLLGFYADELDYYANQNLPDYSFYVHQIHPSNTIVKHLWDGSYNVIYMSNSAIEGLKESTDIPTTANNRLFGEALFLRALVHFYLVNLYGDVPYITTTDYLINKEVSRMPQNSVYEHIIQDLVEAKKLLPDSYIGNERIRANRYVASAFLARVYLYTEKWQLAIQESSSIINNTSVYSLESTENEFLKESRSAIFQFKPKNNGANSNEAATFFLEYGPPYYMSLHPNLMSSFEMDDLRKRDWVKPIEDGLNQWYTPYKYKQMGNTGTSLEYAIVFRLAEQYLIRAEAALQMGDLTVARDDLNTVRNRAGLTDFIEDSIVSVMDAITIERRHELFTEYGHRWYDLKRLGRAENSLQGLKPNWKSTDLLFPIPNAELITNPNLLPQNVGY